MIDKLHHIARERAKELKDPDRKQLIFNAIVECAMKFYPNAMEDGVCELVHACDKAQPDLYVPKEPMWQALQNQYGWMV